MELNGGKVCVCGKRHVLDAVKELVVEEHALEKIPGLLEEAGAHKPFLLMDRNTRRAAGKRVMAILEEAGIPYAGYTYPTSDPIPPAEEALGTAVLHWDPSCDLLLAIGSGVINDLAKLLARIADIPEILVLTAPSMDGMLSPTSAMDVDGLKESVPSRTVWGVVGDLAVLSHAPAHLIASGLGDMLAKYISTTEWKLSNLINGEYYCPEIAGLLRKALDQVLASAPRLLCGDAGAVKEVTDGLLLSGCAMAYAGVTRPASGMEHYISHIIDMRHLAFGTPCDLHGIQCGVGTLFALRIYEELQKIDHIDVDRALASVARFSWPQWQKTLRSFIGPAAEHMIALEEKEHKYDPQRHAVRIRTIARRWPELKAVMAALPKADDVERTMRALGMPTRLTELGVSPKDIPTLVACTKDIRDKYVGTRLLWDIGLLDEIVGKVAAI